LTKSKLLHLSLSGCGQRYRPALRFAPAQKWEYAFHQVDFLEEIAKNLNAKLRNARQIRFSGAGQFLQNSGAIELCGSFELLRFQKSNPAAQPVARFDQRSFMSRLRIDDDTVQVEQYSADVGEHFSRAEVGVAGVRNRKIVESLISCEPMLLNPFSNILRATLLAAILLGSNAYCFAQKSPHRALHMTAEEKSVVASELITVVEQFLEAGQINDPRDRSKFLAAKVFYFGHALTHQQAEKEIISLYRRWPTRKYGQIEEPELFAIPNKRDVYKVTGVYEYELSNFNEHLSGKSKITCVLERGHGGTRIIGLDENLISDSTKYYHD
jgi:hypothetical protein